MTLRLILDTSACLVYARGGDRALGVGETIGQLLDEPDAHYGAPVLCLAEATAQLNDDQAALLDVLVASTICDALPLGDDWRALGFAARVTGSTSRGAAWQEAARNDAYLLTAEPEAYGPDADGIISIA